jgi:hypothetical protein
MAIAGDPRSFADFFPDRLVTDILETLVVSWERMPKPAPNTIETRITRRFAVFIRQEKDRRQLPFRVSVESSLTNPVTYAEAGRIDLSLHPAGSSQEDLYFAFETKRLRVRSDGAVHANTGEYVGNEGMRCFITGQYSTGLPQGGMIGYVMDGQVAAAKAAIKKRIQADAATLQLITGADLAASRHLPAETRAAETRHRLHAREMILHHLFLPL